MHILDSLPAVAFVFLTVCAVSSFLGSFALLYDSVVSSVDPDERAFDVAPMIGVIGGIICLVSTGLAFFAYQYTPDGIWLLPVLASWCLTGIGSGFMRIILRRELITTFSDPLSFVLAFLSALCGPLEFTLLVLDVVGMLNITPKGKRLFPWH